MDESAGMDVGGHPGGAGTYFSSRVLSSANVCRFIPHRSLVCPAYQRRLVSAWVMCAWVRSRSKRASGVDTCVMERASHGCAHVSPPSPHPFTNGVKRLVVRGRNDILAHHGWTDTQRPLLFLLPLCTHAHARTHTHVSQMGLHG